MVQQNRKPHASVAYFEYPTQYFEWKENGAPNVNGDKYNRVCQLPRQAVLRFMEKYEKKHQTYTTFERGTTFLKNIEKLMSSHSPEIKTFRSKYCHHDPLQKSGDVICLDATAGDMNIPSCFILAKKGVWDDHEPEWQSLDGWGDDKTIPKGWQSKIFPKK